ncbi:uncharacterized protein [Henckelia pumila]|uniref:uncharacterized protein n=1 Tax=Henckelia pumila TaxID=405737 RepID=UPI003C6E25E6
MAATYHNILLTSWKQCVETAYASSHTTLDKNMIYLLDSTTNRCRDEEWKKIVTNGVKMYNASRGIPRGPLFKQLTGNIKQSGSVECGFCVMKYMKDIVECENLHLDKMYSGSIRNQYYDQAQFDEIRSE